MKTALSSILHSAFCILHSAFDSHSAFDETSLRQPISVRPILDMQARYETEVFKVARHQRSPVRQGDGRDE